MTVDQKTAVDIKNNFGHKINPTWPMHKSNYTDAQVMDWGAMSDGQKDEYYKFRNLCGKCGGKGYRVNYDMMWGEADLYCDNCESRIRGMDFG